MWTIEQPQQELTAFSALDGVWQARAESWGVWHGHPPPRAKAITGCVLVVVFRLEEKTQKTAKAGYMQDLAGCSVIRASCVSPVLGPSNNSSAINSNWYQSILNTLCTQYRGQREDSRLESSPSCNPANQNRIHCFQWKYSWFTLLSLRLDSEPEEDPHVCMVFFQNLTSHFVSAKQPYPAQWMSLACLLSPWWEFLLNRLWIGNSSGMIPDLLQVDKNQAQQARFMEVLYCLMKQTDTLYQVSICILRSKLDPRLLCINANTQPVTSFSFYLHWWEMKGKTIHINEEMTGELSPTSTFNNPTRFPSSLPTLSDRFYWAKKTCTKIFKTWKLIDSAPHLPDLVAESLMFSACTVACRSVFISPLLTVTWSELWLPTPCIVPIMAWHMPLSSHGKSVLLGKIRIWLLYLLFHKFSSDVTDS